MTVSGEIRFERRVWQCGACRRSHAPVDLAMGLAPKGKWTSGVERKAAYAAALSPFADASNTLRELSGLDLSSSEADRIAQEHGERLDARQRRAEERWRRPVSPHREAPRPEISSEKIVIEADAANVLTIGGEEHKSVYCATVFGLDARGQSGERPFLAKRLYTASAEGMEDFGERAKALAWRGGMRHARAAFIGDGARCLWKWAEENLPAGTVFIQDIWHVCERLSHLAQALFGESWQEAFEKWKGWVRKSRVARVIKELRALSRKRRGPAREALDAELAYLESGRRRMDYARYEKEGWPIGSGAVEGTCKHLIKTRFGVTGARWRRKNIPKILALRVAIFNNEWDGYWRSTDCQIRKAA